MKKTLILLSILSANVFATNVQDFVNDKNCNQIVDKTIFKVCYDYQLKGAKYVAYTVDGEMANAGEHIKKRPSFYVENDIPVKYRSYPEDYTHSGYDRGHLANHADFDYSANILYQTYSMANIIPQNPDVNRDTWIKAEKYERSIAQSLGSVSVINGVDYSNNPERIGKHKIAVPTSFWKIIYNDNKNFKRCFKYENIAVADVKSDKLKDHEVNCTTLINN